MIEKFQGFAYNSYDKLDTYNIRKLHLRLYLVSVGRAT